MIGLEVRGASTYISHRQLLIYFIIISYHYHYPHHLILWSLSILILLRLSVRG